MSDTCRTYRILCLSEAISPISHAAGTSGNESLINRLEIITPQGTVDVPYLSGNCLRNRLVRDPGARWLVEEYGWRGQLTKQRLAFLFSGGALTESGGREDLALLAEKQEVLPLYRLLGGCLTGQIVGGCLSVSHGYLVCEEARSILKALCPASWELPDAPLRPAEAFVTGWQYTRRDTSSDLVEMLRPTGPEDGEESRKEKSSQMIFSGEAVATGSCFLHDLILRHTSRLEVGAVLHSLALWQASGGTVGGASGRGHGRLRTRIWTDCKGDPRAEYVAFARVMRERAVAWLDTAFNERNERIKPVKEKAPPKPKKGKASPPEAAVEVAAQPDLFGGMQ